MTTIALSLTAALVYSLWILFSQRLQRSVSWMTITVTMFTTGVALLAVPALVIDGRPDRSQFGDLGLAALGGLLYTTATGAFLLALRVDKLSLVVVLSYLDGAFAATVSILMGETLNTAAAVGLVLAAGGGLLTAVERDRDTPAHTERRRWRFAAGAGLALVTAMAMAGVFVAYGAIDGFSSFTTVTIASSTGLVVMVPLAAAGSALLPTRRRAAAVLGVGALDMLAFRAASAALALGPVSVASVLLAQTATVSAVVGFLLLRERPAWWQTGGVLATIAGVSLLAWAM